MSILRISDLETATSVTGDEFVIIDDSLTTKKTPINTVTDTIYRALTGTTVSSLSGTVVPAVTAAALPYIASAVESVSASFITSIDAISANIDSQFSELYSNINTLSSFWSGYLQINDASVDYIIASTDAGAIITYSDTQNITAFITPQINTTGFATTVAQLSTGTVTLALSSDYTAKLISYESLFTTAGEGAVLSLIRTSNDTFLITGLLQ